MHPTKEKNKPDKTFKKSFKNGGKEKVYIPAFTYLVCWMIVKPKRNEWLIQDYKEGQCILKSLRFPVCLLTIWL